MYIVAGFFNILIKHFEDTGIDVPGLFSRFGGNANVLKNPVARVDANIFGRYLEMVVEKTGNNRIGLESGFIIPFTITGTIFNLYHGNSVVSEIFENLDLFDTTANDICQYKTYTENDLFYYEIYVEQEFFDKYPEAARQWYELQYGISLQYAYSYTGRNLFPVLAHSPYGKEGERDKLEDLLNCPVLYNQKSFSLIFNKSVLDLPIITANKDLLPILENLINEIREAKAGNNLPEAVRRYILDNVSKEGINLRSVARNFNMSERNIQRKLKDEGTSYQIILDNIRMELSRKYLKKKIPLTEIAFLLGFGSQSAFNKFYRKHFGLSPGQMV